MNNTVVLCNAGIHLVLDKGQLIEPTPSSEKVDRSSWCGGHVGFYRLRPLAQ